MLCTGILRYRKSKVTSELLTETDLVKFTLSKQIIELHFPSTAVSYFFGDLRVALNLLVIYHVF